jgi:hypothetical protein
MFDWVLFMILIAICIPGLLVLVPNTIRTVRGPIQQRLPEGRTLPSTEVLVLASTVQTMILVAIAVATGVLVADDAGFGAPFFAALAAGENPWAALQPQLLPALIWGGAGSAVFLVLYYAVFRPRLEPGNVACSENLRMALGLPARILYGGIVEEVLIRWGLMSLLAWLGTLLAGEPAPAVIWVAILVSGVLFGLGHLPGYLAVGCQRTPMLLASMTVVNLWAALIFSWLFWQYGLAAAMLAHMLFHIVWWPFDMRYAARPTSGRPGQD